jgi:uncharacterized protein (DUF2147 family)
MRSLALPLLFLAALPAAAQAPSGAWRFVDDGTVIEFVACKDALCGHVRALPQKHDPNDGPPPRCGQEVLAGFKPQGDQWAGEVQDPGTNKRYGAKLRRDQQTNDWDLVIKALGGLYTETLRLQPAPADFQRCR